MKLIKLKTKNFKKLGDAEFNFTDGLNILVGDNATGKSTTLQAIEAALFGVTVIPGKKENIPTWGQSTFSLELTFRVEAHEYVLTRTKSTAKLVRCGVESEPELVANGNTPVTSYIEELLGLTAKDFNLFILSRQGETASILTFGATALARKVEEFAGIQMIDKVQALANERSREASAEALAHEVTADEMAEAEEALDVADKTVEEALSALSACKAAREAIVAPTINPPPISSETLLRQARAAANAIKQRDAAQSAYASAVATLEELQSEPVANPGELGDIGQRVLETREKLKQARTELKDTESAVALAKQKRDWLEAAEAALAALVVEDDAEDLEALANNRQSLTNLETELAQVKLKIEQLQELSKGAQCPTCGTALSEHDPEKLKAEIVELEDQADSLRLSIRFGGEIVNGLEQAVAKVAQQRQERDRLTAQVESLQSRQSQRTEADLEAPAKAVADLEAQLEADSAALAVHEQKLTAYRSYLRRLDRAEKAVDAAREALEAVVVPESVPTPEEIDAAIAQENEAAAAQQAYKVAVVDADSKIKVAEMTLAAAEQAHTQAMKDLHKLQAKAMTHSRAAVNADKARRLSRFLGDRRSGYLKEVWDAVMAAATKQVQTSFKGIEKLVYRDGEFLYVENGIEAPVTAASGAQRANIGAALRVGLARALYGNNSLLMFDEPTESSSEYRAGELVASLIGAAKQTLVITHRQQDQNLADNLILLGE